LCFRERDLVVARIEPHQDVSGIDVLLIFDAHLNHVPGNPRAQRVDVAVDLGIVCGFVGIHVSPHEVTHDTENNDDGRGDEIACNPRLFTSNDWVLLQSRHGYFTSRSLWIASSVAPKPRARATFATL